MELIPEVQSVCQPLMGSRYTKLKQLGAGNFGVADLVLDKQENRHRVVKRLQKSVLQMDARAIAESRVEIANLRRVTHPNVVRYLDGWFDNDKHLHMVMEYCESGDLEEFVQERFPLPEVLVRSIFTQLIAGLDEMHHNHVLHRDIKAKNIFLKRVFAGNPRCTDPIFLEAAKNIGRHVDPRTLQLLATDKRGYAIMPKIGDFGLSKAVFSTDSRTRTVAGTPFHFSPELAKSQPYSRRSDIWSMGVLFYFVLTKTFPFMGKTIPAVLNAVVHDEVQHLETRYKRAHGTNIPYSKDLLDIVMDMLNKTEQLRPTTDELLSRKYFGGSGIYVHVASPPCTPLSVTPSSLQPRSSAPVRNTTPPKQSSNQVTPANCQPRKLSQVHSSHDVYSSSSSEGSESEDSDFECDEEDDEDEVIVPKCKPVGPRNKLVNYKTTGLCSFSEVPAQVHVPKKHIPRQPPPPQVRSNDAETKRPVRARQDSVVEAQKPTFVSGAAGFVLGPQPTKHQRPPSPPIAPTRVATPPKRGSTNQQPPSSRKGSSPIRTDVTAGKGTSPIRKRASPLRQTKTALPPIVPQVKPKSRVS